MSLTDSAHKCIHTMNTQMHTQMYTHKCIHTRNFQGKRDTYEESGSASRTELVLPTDILREKCNRKQTQTFTHTHARTCRVGGIYTNTNSCSATRTDMHIPRKSLNRKETRTFTLTHTHTPARQGEHTLHCAAHAFWAGL